MDALREEPGTPTTRLKIAGIRRTRGTGATLFGHAGACRFRALSRTAPVNELHVRPIGNAATACGH